MLFMLLGGWVLSRRTPRQRGGLSAAVHSWGTQPLSPQLAIHLVQVGERLLVLGAGAEGLRTLAEITDPGEVAHLRHLCRVEPAERPAFRSVWEWLWGRRPDSSLHPPLWDQLPRPSTSGAAAARERTSSAVETPSRPLASRSVHSAGIVLALVLSGSSLVAQDQGGGGFGSAAAFPARVTGANEISPLPASRALPSSQRGTLQPAAAFDPAPSTDGSQVPVRPEQALPAAIPDPKATLGGPGPWSWVPTGGLAGTLQLGLFIGVVSLAPAILLMTTCYVRIIVVLGLLRQGLGVSQFPPTQVLTALALFLTGLVMWPVWSRAYSEGIAPYSQAASPDEAALRAAWSATLQPVRNFMSRQIEATGNTATLDLLLEYQSGPATAAPEYYEDVPLPVLLPAYVLSELRTAFLIGFQIYLPFLVIDLAASSVLSAVGLQLLSPAVVALPFKLLLFVLVDGWHLTVELLLRSIAPAV